MVLAHDAALHEREVAPAHLARAEDRWPRRGGLALDKAGVARPRDELEPRRRVLSRGGGARARGGGRAWQRGLRAAAAARGAWLGLGLGLGVGVGLGLGLGLGLR